MSVYHTFCEVFYSDELELDLDIFYYITDYDPSVGVDYEFEWEALDENGKDHHDDLTGDEEYAIERLIRKHINENINSYDDF
jgi:hypothetical protein